MKNHPSDLGIYGTQKIIQLASPASRIFSLEKWKTFFNFCLFISCLATISDRPNFGIVRNQPNRTFGHSLSETSAKVLTNRTLGWSLILQLRFLIPWKNINPNLEIPAKYDHIYIFLILISISKLISYLLIKNWDQK